MNLAEQLHELVTHEPPYLLDPDRALAGGRRRKRARATGLAAAVGVSAVAVVGTVLALQPSRPAVQQTLFGSSPTAEPAAQGSLEKIVRSHTPKWWTFADVQASRADELQVNVDDGDGASRFYVGVSPSPGSLQQHPCSDHEFALGGFCREVDLDADTRLITRGPTASGPVTSSFVVIVHRDGSGVDVGNDNATWRTPPDGVLTAETKAYYATPSVNRPLPVYSLAQLVEIAKAVDAATSAR